ncbi:MAG TPA: M28 family metallopeptidase [Gaiellaceae bacterium]|nr:M28 family metallopeptidase [Gaiellaceae bacterium]
MGTATGLLQTLADEIGVRQCGTEAAGRAAEAIAAAFRDLGLEPDFQEFPLLRYDAEEPELWVDGERWRAGPCMYAHPGECEGEIEVLSDGLWAVGEGRLARSIFGRGPIPFGGRFTLAGHIATPPTAFLSRADSERIREGQRARLVVRGSFVAGQRDRNVVARIPGKTDERIVVGAHYDSVWHGPGAIDNATGVEGLWRVAEHFAGTEPTRTIELVAFGAEEIGLVGARRFVADARERDTLDSIVGMVNLDCIGCGELLELLCSPAALLERTRAAAERLGLTERYEVVTEIGEEAGTDHLPFAQAGIPAVSILHFPYEEYHLPEDTLGLVEERRLADAVALAIDIVQSLVDDPVPRA